MLRDDSVQRWPMILALTAGLCLSTASIVRSADDPARAQPPVERPGSKDPRAEASKDALQNVEPDSKGGGQRPTNADPKAMRSALTGLIEHMRAAIPRLEKAVADLDQGKDANEVRRELMNARGSSNGGLAGIFESLRKSGLGPRRDEAGTDGGKPAETGRGAPRAPLTAEDRQKIISEIGSHNPELAKQLEDLRKTAPDAVDGFVRTLGEKLRGLRDSQKDPETYQLRREDLRGMFEVLRLRRDLGEAMRKKADEPTIMKLKSEMRAELSKIGKIRDDLDRIQLRQLEARSAKLKGDLEKRTANHDKLVDERTEQIVRETQKSPPAPKPEPKQ